MWFVLCARFGINCSFTHYTELFTAMFSGISCAPESRAIPHCVIAITCEVCCCETGLLKFFQIVQFWAPASTVVKCSGENFIPVTDRISGPFFYFFFFFSPSFNLNNLDVHVDSLGTVIHCSCIASYFLRGGVVGIMLTLSWKEVTFRYFAYYMLSFFLFLPLLF